jgi:FkbM family methyltransferase
MNTTIQVQVPQQMFISQPLGFVLASSDYGSVIVNRFDQNRHGDDPLFGVSYQILEAGMYEPAESALYLRLLRLCRQHRGDGLVAIDAGANLGMHTIQWARMMRHWGSVIAVEPQERIFYALCGNITLGNHFNAHAVHGALGDDCKRILVPQPDYLKQGSFGSLELRGHDDAEDIGQPIDYSTGLGVDMFTLDSLKLNRLDLLKIDVENMELPVLWGGRDTIMRCQPFIAVETCKNDEDRLLGLLKEFGYQRMIDMGAMFVFLPDQPLVDEWMVSDVAMAVTYALRDL